MIDPKFGARLPPMKTVCICAFIFALALVLAARPGFAENDTPAIEIGSELSLSEAVDLALGHNLDLKIQRTEVDDSRQGLQIVKSDFDPELTSSTNSNFSLSPRSSTQLDGASQPERRSASLDAGLNKKLETGATIGLRSEILDRSKTNSSFTTLNPEFNTALRLQVRQPLLKNAGFHYNLSPIRIAELRIDESNQQLLGALLETLRETENRYWTVVAAEEEREIITRSIELAEFIVDEAEGREGVGLATETDVLEAKSSLAERRELLLQAQANVAAGRDQLYALLGLIRVADPSAARFEKLPEHIELKCDPSASFERARQRAPSLQIASIQAEVRREEVSRQRNQLQPQLDLVFSTGALGRDGTFGGAQSSVADIDGHFWDVGFEVTVPLGNRAERAQLRQSENALERAKLTEENTLIDLYTLVRAACRDVELSYKRYEATESTIEFARSSLEKQRERYRNEDDVTIRDVLLAQNDLDSALFRQVQAQIRELAAIVQLAEVEGTLPERYGLKLGEEE
ncbi:MAG: outer membrane protein [Verrucomicrobiales bacterium]